MVQRLHLTMEVTERHDGSFEARCPELSVSAHGQFADEAIENLKEIVFSSMADGFDMSFDQADSSEILRGVLARNRQCYIHIPRDDLAH